MEKKPCYGRIHSYFTMLVKPSGKGYFIKSNDEIMRDSGISSDHPLYIRFFRI